MLFCAKKYRIESKQVLSKLTPVLIYELISPIKHTQQLDKCLGNRKMLIWYDSSEAEDKLKLVDNKCEISTSQHKTEQTRVRFFVPFI